MPTARTTPTDPADATLADVRRIHRQVCLLRAQGDTAGAEALCSGELSAALARLPGSAGPAQIQQVFAEEETRLADAEALAGLLGPMLIRQLAARELPALPDGPAPSAAGRNPPRRRDPATVADFIDQMLAAETAARTAH